VCSNAFQRSLELKLIEGLQVEQNMEKVTTLMKGLSGYYLKEPELEQILCNIIQKNHEEFTLKQLEILIWSLSKRLNGMCIDKELMTETCRTIIKRV
jgi:AAA+ superfamily predicted ATPase